MASSYTPNTHTLVPISPRRALLLLVAFTGAPLRSVTAQAPVFSLTPSVGWFLPARDLVQGSDGVFVEFGGAWAFGLTAAVYPTQTVEVALEVLAASPDFYYASTAPGAIFQYHVPASVKILALRASGFLRLGAQGRFAFGGGPALLHHRIDSHYANPREDANTVLGLNLSVSYRQPLSRSFTFLASVTDFVHRPGIERGPSASPSNTNTRLLQHDLVASLGVSLAHRP